MDLSLAKLLMSPQKKLVSSAKFTISISWSPVCTSLIPCHYHWNGWQPWLQQHRETWRVGSLENYIHGKGKGSYRRPFIFIFRLNIVLHDSCQVDEIVMEIEEWKEKVPDNYVKSFRRVLFSLLETSVVS